MAVIPQVLNDIFQSLSLIDSTTSPQIDWKETQEAHVFKVDVPGLNKEEVKVEVAEEGRFLQISGDIRGADKEVAQENDKWRRAERPRGKFCRRFLLPAENVELDEVKACMENGVLTVTIPKKEIKKPQLKTIEITV